MKRRRFLQNTAMGAAAVSSIPLAVGASELEAHHIAKVEIRKADVRWPRHVGKNAVRGHHGNGPVYSVCVIHTNEGATGWGHIQGPQEIKQSLIDSVVGKPVSALFDPTIGIRDESLHQFDIPLHDLAGVILGQPVWKMISGEKEPFLTKVYSGMIYFDDLDPEEKPAGIDKVLENCQWDYDYGYRQFKVKIGRGTKWMDAVSGLQRDIDVVKAIQENFPDVEILVDGNNGFTVETMIQFCEGIGDVSLFWIEEPFHETPEDWRKLKDWLVGNGRENTLRADGEAKPDFPVLENLQTDGTLQVRLEDICGHGFTKWRKQMPELKKTGVMVSPHTWGSALKSVYTAHFAGAYGSSPTVEGVTSVNSSVDFGENRIINAQLRPSSEPGFGMKLKA